MIALSQVWDKLRRRGEGILVGVVSVVGVPSEVKTECGVW